MKTQLFPKSDRGIKDIGWLQSRFYFSFSDYANPVRSTFGTLIAFNDDSVAQGKGFGIHPHQNMEIISILLHGKMNHIDTLGYSTTVEEGSVQIMSAGSGLRHEEYNIGEEPVSFLQIWIQPKIQNITPRYQMRSFPKAQRVNRLQTIVWSEEGLDHCWINQNSRLSMGYFDRNERVSYAFHQANKCLFIFIIEGAATIGEQRLTERDAIGIWDTAAIDITVEASTHFLIIETPVNQK